MTQTLEISSADDTLRFKLQAAKVIVQHDVKLSINIAALTSTQNYQEKALEERIRMGLDRFIEADWVFGAMRRVGDAVGYERVEMRASARIPVKEAYDLDARARRAGIEGLSLTEPVLDYALPASAVNAAVEELRAFLLDDASKHAQRFSAQTGRTWRIGDMAFGINAADDLRTGKGAYRGDSDRFLENVGTYNAGVATSERICLYADVTLRSPA
ncbi:hypothetical protein [Chitinimonas sp.]|uniref:hypothetical protein n=1 Tax=Chitinimonas sp. TaxID=1934313 RepID=UPI0035B4D259